MKALFVDTGAWVALRYKRDQHHERARELLVRARSERVELITSEWILAESVTLLKARGAVDHAIALGAALMDGSIGRLIEPNTARRTRAWQLFVRHRDRRVGYVDCTSFAIMEELRLRTAFGFDRDFVAAGFSLYG